MLNAVAQIRRCNTCSRKDAKETLQASVGDSAQGKLRSALQSGARSVKWQHRAGGAHLGNQVPEALQEGVDLGLDGCCHAMACHQVDILPLVLLCHSAIGQAHS